MADDKPTTPTARGHHHHTTGTETPAQKLRAMLRKLTGQPRFLAGPQVTITDCPENPTASEDVVVTFETLDPNLPHYLFLSRVPWFDPCVLINRMDHFIPGVSPCTVNLGPTGDIGTHVVRVWAIDECGVPGPDDFCTLSITSAAYVEQLVRYIELIQRGKEE